MSRKLSATDVFEELEVDLWGNAYKLRVITKTVALKLADAQKRLNAIDPQTVKADTVAGQLIALIDLLLEPAEKAKPAGEVLTPLWDSDELGLDWLTAFSDRLREEAQARRRPTSPPATSS